MGGAVGGRKIGAGRGCSLCDIVGRLRPPRTNNRRAGRQAARGVSMF